MFRDPSLLRKPPSTWFSTGSLFLGSNMGPCWLQIQGWDYLISDQLIVSSQDFPQHGDAYGCLKSHSMLRGWISICYRSICYSSPGLYIICHTLSYHIRILASPPSKFWMKISAVFTRLPRTDPPRHQDGAHGHCLLLCHLRCGASIQNGPEKI